MDTRIHCICKTKLIDTIIRECTSVINETMINNVDNKDNGNTITYIFIELFTILLFGIVCFCLFAYFKWIKGKKLFKKNILIIEHIKNGYKVISNKNQN